MAIADFLEFGGRLAAQNTHKFARLEWTVTWKDRARKPGNRTAETTETNHLINFLEASKLNQQNDRNDQNSGTGYGSTRVVDYSGKCWSCGTVVRE